MRYRFTRKHIIALYAVTLFLAVSTFTYFHPLQFTSYQLAFANPAPQVMPALQEWHGSSGSFALTYSSRIVVDSSYSSQLLDSAQVFQSDLSSETGNRLPVVIADSPNTGDFFLTLKNQDSSLGNEGYIFNAGEALVISAHTSTGVFYGTRTALQILREDSARTYIPRGTAIDYPQYAERGFMLDVGRKFFPISFLEDYVRFMAWYKMNNFQLHLNDNAIGAGNSPDWMHQYAAFRLNSSNFPGLAAKDGSYTKQDILALERVARQYHVTITPEIDAPAHDLAFTQYRPDLASPKYSKDILDLSNPNTYTFLESIWNEFLPWFDSSQLDIGVDEYVPGDANGARQFINILDTYLNQKGKTVRMWGSLTKLKSNIQVNTNIVIDDWNNSWANPVDMVNQGFHIINMNDNLLYIVPRAGYYHDYLDTKQLYEQWEPNIFDFSNPRLNLAPNDPHLLGGMFAVWNDKLGKIVSDADVHARVKPAMQTLSEKLWSGPINALPYNLFQQLAVQIGDPPGTHLPTVS
ncbi:MAG TPA: family 20 glycosylhydrolase [Ktedonobacteraceae bacterium]